MKLRLFAFFAAVLSYAVLPAKAATTGTVFTIPSGSSGHATIEFVAPVALDSYTVKIHCAGVGELGEFHLITSTPLNWMSGYGTIYSGVTWSVYAPYRSGSSVSCHVELSGLPPGDYSISYDGTGVVNTPWIINSESELLAFMDDWFNWYPDYSYPPSGPYTYTVSHAANMMSISVTDYGY
jgi:hypothetical protein